MFKRKFFPALYVILCSSAMAQNNYVTLYEDCNYSGKKHFIEAGNYRLYQMKIDNDKLSCLQIPSGMKVTIYEDDNFEGKSKTFNENIACLEGEWNDMASSIVVENQNYQPGYNQNDYVIFYNDCNSKGFSQTLRPGRFMGYQLGNLKYNISSFTIYGNLRVKTYINNEELSGYSFTHDLSETCLSSAENDKIGSLIIEYKPIQPQYYPSGGSGNFVKIFTDCNYSGNSLSLVPGYYQGDKLGLLKYNISAIQIPSGLKAKVFINNEDLTGNYYTLSDNINCMNSTLNNRIGSIVIEETNNYNNNNQQYQYNQNERVVIYTDANYQGQSASLYPGSYNTMAQAGFPDNALSSLILPAGYRVILYEFENFSGKSYTVNKSKSGFMLSSWNDKTSSIKVIRDW
ncbi:MAG: hypothetical protein ACRDEB_05235 [Chitinophagaceae bacterium]